MGSSKESKSKRCQFFVCVKFFVIFLTGCFVKKICGYLQAIVEDRGSCDNGTDLKQLFEDCDISIQNIQELFVLNKNNSKSIFCDTGN